MLREARIKSRDPAQTAAKAENAVLPAPVGGWSSDASIALENPSAAEVMENFFPTTKGVRARGGARRFATTGLTAIQDCLVYVGTNSEKLFAAANGKLYDVTSVINPYDVPPAVVTGQTSNEYSYVNFATAGGDFMLCFNGTDLHRVYDGATWTANTPAITGVSSANINQVAVHANRVWMVQKDSKVAWYLPIDSVGGVAISFALTGVFKRGGKLLFISTWSQDAGDGSSDRCVFVSDQGEVAVYGGDYPGGTWKIFGRYDIARPMGRFAFQRVGGDLLILTLNGIVPMSEVVSKDPAALTTTAITKYIEPDWKELTEQFADRNWRFMKWDQRNLGIISIPSNTTQVTGSSVWGESFVWGLSPWGSGWTIEVPIGVPTCFAVNLKTGRWAKITGWDCRSMAIFKDEFVFGTSSGAMLYGDKGGNDDGNSYECRLAYWPSRFDYVGEKQFLQARSVFEHSTSFNPKISISVNNKITWSSQPGPPSEDNTSSLWDSGLWDVAVFDAKGEKRVRTEKWVSLGRRGHVGALMLQMTFNNSTTPDVEYTDTIITYEKAALVT